MTEKINVRFGVLILMVLAAAFSRLIPHPPNFAPIGALGLFGAAYFTRKWIAIILPLASLWLSDVVINNTLYAQYYKEFTFFYDGFYWIYGTIALTTFLGFYMLKKVSVKNVLASSILASILFFLITNFGCWPSNPMYSQDFKGLIACYIAGIPFFGGTLAGNIFYSIVLFGGFELAKSKFPVLELTNNV